MLRPVFRVHKNRIEAWRGNKMVTSGKGQFLTTLRNPAHFPCTKKRSPVLSRLPWITLDRFAQACSVCAAPSETLLFPSNCFFPNFQLLDLPSPPYSTRSFSFILQKLFHFDKVIVSTNSVKSDGQFSQKFSMRLVDEAVLFIINYKKYKKVLFLKRNYYAFAEFE
jgi:hypothetical protein